jgi:hypothetical protein
MILSPKKFCHTKIMKHRAVADLKLAASGLPLMATDVVAEGTQFKFINFDKNKQACNHYIQHT